MRALSVRGFARSAGDAFLQGLPDLVRLVPDGCATGPFDPPRLHDLPRRTAMMRWLMRRRIAAFERTYDYDMGYVRDMLEVSPRAVRAFGRIGALGQYRRDVPAEAYVAATLVAVRWEDCGPCTQLTVTMAERAGVAPAMLRAVLARDERAMTEDTRLGFRFAEAVLAHEPEADTLRDEIVARWGRHALISLGFGMAAARLYPTVKYALGHGKACTRITVAGASVPVLREAA